MSSASVEVAEEGEVVAGIDRRGALRLAGAVGVAGGVAGIASACGVDRDTETEPEYDSHVRIGLLVPEAGGYRTIGDDIVNGFRRFLAVNGNRLGGHPYVIHQEDEGESADDALAGLERLLEQDVHAVAGVATSAALVGISAAVEERNIPLLGANASPQEVQGVPYIWRTSYLNQEPGLALGGHLVTEVNGPVAIIAQDDATGNDAIAGLAEAFARAQSEDQLAEPILTPANAEPQDGFFQAALTQVRDQNPEAVFAVYAGVAAEQFVREYLGAGLDPQRLHGPADLTEGGVLTEVGADAIGIKSSANYAPELLGAANRSFTVAYRNEFDRPPTTYAVAGYDAAVALDRAIQLAGESPTPRDINLRLGEIGLIDSPRGQWQFNQGRTPIQRWYLREVAADGPELGNLVIRELDTLG